MNETATQQHRDAATDKGLRRVTPARHHRVSAAGFTLIELIISLTILSILITSVVPMARYAEKRQKEQELRENLRMIRQAIDRHKKFCDANPGAFSLLDKPKEEQHCYPKDLNVLVEGITINSNAPGGGINTTGVLNGTIQPGQPLQSKEIGADLNRKIRFLNRIPKDPMTTSGEWELRSMQDEPDSSGGKDNVFDVHSKSTEKGLNGVPYNKW